jgi:ribosomal protein S8
MVKSCFLIQFQTIQKRLLKSSLIVFLLLTNFNLRADQINQARKHSIRAARQYKQVRDLEDRARKYIERNTNLSKAQQTAIMLTGRTLVNKELNTRRYLRIKHKDMRIYLNIRSNWKTGESSAGLQLDWSF